MSASNTPSSSASALRLSFAVRASPGAARTQLQGWYGQALKIRVAAVPEDGAANRALLRWLQQASGAVAAELLSGGSGRNKLVALDFAEAAPSLDALYERLLNSKVK